jgi:hypothetical protein
MTRNDVPAEKRAEWRAWAVREFGDDQGSVELATESALKSLITGYSVEQSIAIARAAVLGEPPGTGVNGSMDEAGTKLVAAEHLVSDAEHLRGRISLFRSRPELMGTQYGTVWNFRVDSWDSEGRSQPAVAVEMRGLQFNGSLGEGDWVEIPGPWEAGKNLRVGRLRNITMNAPVIVDDSETSNGKDGREASKVGAVPPARRGKIGFIWGLVVIALAVAGIFFILTGGIF